MLQWCPRVKYLRAPLYRIDRGCRVMNSLDIVRFLHATHALTSEDLLDNGITLIDDIRSRFAIRKLRIGSDYRLLLKQAVSDEGVSRLQQEIFAFKFLNSLVETRQ